MKKEQTKIQEPEPDDICRDEHRLLSREDVLIEAFLLL